MRILGELCLLSAFVGSGFAAFACAVGWSRRHRGLLASGVGAAIASIAALTAVLIVLAWALVHKNYHFAYVAQYSSDSLPWHYGLSALWVGQAGSLLLWSWLSGLLALLYGVWSRRQTSHLRHPVFAVLMGYVCFLVAIMVFAADPMEPSISNPQDGAGLSPLLQHPAMLIHPPIVFLGYALWAIPFALAAVALVTGRLDSHWVKQARPWALCAWIVLGTGILLGAQWAYEELGWGGYWGWDPVENGSLIPWLTGTALIHALMAWQHRGQFRKTAVALAIATFGLCNFATFLTRSGIFSSLHAFSQSPIGWLFLVLMLVLALGGSVLIVRRRGQLAPSQPIQSILSREAFILISTIALLLLTTVTLVGTLSMALSNLVVGRPIMMGPAFYNNVLTPTGLVLLATTALAPLLRWGKPPTTTQRRGIMASAGCATVAAAIAWMIGVRHPIGLAVAWLAFFAVLVLLSSVLFDARRFQSRHRWFGVIWALRDNRRLYASFVIHMGFVCLALGVTGSSLGTQQREFRMSQGDRVTWCGRDIRLVRVSQEDSPDKLVGQAELEVSRDGQVLATLVPAQHFHLLQQVWTTEVAIHSTWRGDLYTILHTGDEQGNVRLTFVDNPMMRWMWFGGWVMGWGVLMRLWPSRRRRRADLKANSDCGPTGATAPARRGLAAAALLMVWAANSTALPEADSHGGGPRCAAINSTDGGPSDTARRRVF